MKTRTIVVAASLLAVLAGGGWMGRSWLFPPALPDGILEGNGRIEGTEVAVSSKISGRILKLAVAEGDQLRQGDLIALLDAEELQQRLAQGEARVAAAQSRATLSEDEARSQLSEASARLRAAEERLNQVRARIEVLAHHAEKARLDHRRDRDLFGKGFISERQLSNSENALKLAEGELRDANAALAATRAEADAARAQRDGLAQKTPALLDTFRKEAAAAEAARDELKVMLADAKVTAPVDGTVVTRAREPGELVQPGQPLVVLVDLVRPYLKVYVPERDIGKVKLGDPARVFVDSFPDRPFDAVVTQVAHRAEFTPKDVHMPDERVSLVYAVRLDIKNPEGVLKPGMPADALIRWKPDALWEK